MTERLKGVLVTFTHDIREDEAESILTAIRMIRGVQDVSAVPASIDDWSIRVRLHSEFQTAILKLLKEFKL